MIKTRADLSCYLKEDLARFGHLPQLKDWILRNERWYIWQYIKSLRYVEYYINNNKKNHPFFLFWWFRYKRLGFKLRYTVYPNTCGKGLMIYHTGDLIFIKRAAKLGDHCTLRPGVVIGNKHGEGEGDMPVEVGNNVEFGLGVRVFGKITIGDNVTIGANSVVTKDIPSGVIAGGVPAKIIKSSIQSC